MIRTVLLLILILLAGCSGESKIDKCTENDQCIVVPYNHCCGATKRAINSEYLEEYQNTPEWQSFDEPEVCQTTTLCPQDELITEAACIEKRCALLFP